MTTAHCALLPPIVEAIAAGGDERTDLRAARERTASVASFEAYDSPQVQAMNPHQ